MTRRVPTRHELVSRRAMLRTSLGTGAFLLIPGVACGNRDATVFAGETVSPPSSDEVPDTTTQTDSAAPSSSNPSSTTVDGIGEPAGDQTTAATTEEAPAATEQPASTIEQGGSLAVNGELVVSFTYTQGPTGKNERPYVAVWIEDGAGELVETVALWYQQRRRGERWLDHLSRWYEVDLARQATGGADEAATISSATRSPGSYAVAWDGLADGTPIAAGDYFVCIEAVREEGPYSLIREPFALSGSLADTALPDEGELSLASVRIDG